MTKVSISEATDPFARKAALVDVDASVLLDNLTVVVLEPGQLEAGNNTEPIVCLELAGRINHQQGRSDVLYLMDAEGAAAIVADLIGLLGRGRADIGDAFEEALNTALDALPKRPTTD